MLKENEINKENKELNLKQKIEKFLISITETDEYNDIKYLVFSIRKSYLEFLTNIRLEQFKTPLYLKPLINVVVNKFNDSGIHACEMLEYMLENDIHNWVHYYNCIIPTIKKESLKLDKNPNEVFAMILTAYILDMFSEHEINIQKMINNEKLIYKTNKYGLSIVNGVEFRRDYFIYDEKAYLYNLLTDNKLIEFTDSMPGFAKIITEKVNSGDILLRLDERLALPVKQAITYSTLNFDKFYGPQFKFKESNLINKKRKIVHFDEKSLDKLLMVIKPDYNQSCNEEFLHIEIETLPYINEKSKVTHCITTFLHGIYYPKGDYFTHIDFARNQYVIGDYLKKYLEEDNIPIDLYTEKDLHYKIWCIENGNYSREVWYELMIASLDKKYQKLLDEMLE